jgi:putative tryptophan/tyrosine transport system substrate-binding protein
MAINIARRRFVAALGATAAWPLAASAQQPARTHHIGVLMAWAENEPEGKAEAGALEDGLSQLGWTAGRNLQIDYRWPGSDIDRIRAAGAELVATKPDVLIARSTPETAALLQATHTIPIVFVGTADPLGSGFIASLARPGGNATGFTNFESSIGGKWLELLKQVSPKLASVAILFNAKTAPYADIYVRSMDAGAAMVAVETTGFSVDGPAQIVQAIELFAQRPNGGLVCIPDLSNTANRDLIISLAARNRLPAIYPYADFARNGGLIAYAVDSVDLMRRAAGDVERIFKGEKPADVPVQQPEKFVLAVNLRTAKTLGLDIPPTLLATADEVIE